MADLKKISNCFRCDVPMNYTEIYCYYNNDKECVLCKDCGKVYVNNEPITDEMRTKITLGRKNKLMREFNDRIANMKDDEFKYLLGIIKKGKPFQIAHTLFAL